ncbi:hypothetical protein XI09_16925 [Bradyrhizobium sp. CCBAU 11386]|nr:hypothetical protein [Bradyrhizobium sp. CCBAU 11386]
MLIAGPGNEPADPSQQSGYPFPPRRSAPPAAVFFSAAICSRGTKNPASIAEDTDGAFVLGLHRIAEASHLQVQPMCGDFVPARIEFF